MTEQEALAWIAGVFEESPEDLKSTTHRTDVPAWDSLGVLTLMAGLDSDFNIVLTEDEVGGLEVVGDVLQVLRRNGKLV